MKTKMVQFPTMFRALALVLFCESLGFAHAQHVRGFGFDDHENKPSLSSLLNFNSDILAIVLGMQNEIRLLKADNEALNASNQQMKLQMEEIKAENQEVNIMNRARQVQMEEIMQLDTHHKLAVSSDNVPQRKLKATSLTTRVSKLEKQAKEMTNKTIPAIVTRLDAVEMSVSLLKSDNRLDEITNKTIPDILTRLDEITNKTLPAIVTRLDAVENSLDLLRCDPVLNFLSDGQVMCNNIENRYYASVKHSGDEVCFANITTYIALGNMKGCVSSITSVELVLNSGLKSYAAKDTTYPYVLNTAEPLSPGQYSLTYVVYRALGVWFSGVITFNVNGFTECSTRATLPASYNGHLYDIGSRSVSWFDGSLYAGSSQICCDKTSHLVTITSSEENLLVLQMKDSVAFADVWIGASDTREEGAFEWVTNETFGYHNWGTDEPNDANGGEDCVMLRDTGVWNDAPCGDEYAVVIEYDCM